MTKKWTTDAGARGCLVVACLVGVSVAPASSAAEKPSRSLEAASGITVAQAARADSSAWVGAGLGVRWYATTVLHLDPAVSYSLGVDLRNPERGEPFHVLATGAGVGARLAITRALSLQPSARADWLRAWHWPGAHEGARGVSDGARVVAGLGVALSLGTAWGHALGVEPRIDAAAVFLPGAVEPLPPRLQGSVWFTGVLLPEPHPPMGK